DVPRGQRLEERARGIEAGDRLAVEAPAFLVEIPPRQAVDRRDHHRVRGDERLQAGQHRRDRMRLEEDEDRVLRPEIGGLRRVAQRMDLGLASGNQGQSPSADRLEMSAAGDERHLVPGLRKPRSDYTAHRAGADDANPHAAPFRGSGARMKSRTGAICSSLISQVACPTPGNSTNLTRAPPTCIRLTVDSSRRSDSAPRSTSLGHSTWSQAGHRSMPKRKSLPNSTPAFPLRRMLLTIAGSRVSV